MDAFTEQLDKIKMYKCIHNKHIRGECGEEKDSLI